MSLEMNEAPSVETLFGKDLLKSRRFRQAAGWKPRTFVTRLSDFFLSEEKPDDVALLFGLRRTGKTTAFMHAVQDIVEKGGAAELDRTAYLNADGVPWTEVEKLLKELRDKKFRNILIDEATQSRGFLQRCGLLSDIFTDVGMRIAVTGTDSLSLFLAARTGLLDRCRIIHSTRIPYPEWAELKNNYSITTFIRWGGILSDVPTKGEELHSRNPFTQQNANGYFMSSISYNIQRTVYLFHDDEYRGDLDNIFAADKMHDVTSAIFNNFICADFLKNVKALIPLSKEGELVSSTNRLATGNKKRGQWKPADFSQLRHSSIIKEADENLFEFLSSKSIAEKISEKVAEMLDIHDRLGNKLVDPVVRHEIMKYLKALEVVARRPSKAILPLEPTAMDLERYNAMQPTLQDEMLVSQPGLRYSQIYLLEDVLDKLGEFQSLSLENKKKIKESMRHFAEWQILEDVVLQETMEAAQREGLPKDSAFKASFPFEEPGMEGEFDMAVSIPGKGCWIFEIKRREIQEDSQFKHLVNEDFCRRIEKSTGQPVVQRTVLYLGGEECVKTVRLKERDGSDAGMEAEVSYCNAEKFLRRIWRQGLSATLETGCGDLPEPDVESDRGLRP